MVFTLFQINKHLVICSIVIICLNNSKSGRADSCTDRSRALIMDSCEELSKYHQQFLSSAETQIVKRENEKDPHYDVTEVLKKGLFIECIKQIYLRLSIKLDCLRRHLQSNRLINHF